MRTCDDCAGKGYTVEFVNAEPITTICKNCRGTGKVDLPLNKKDDDKRQKR